MYKIARSLAKAGHFDVISAQGPNEIGFVAYRVAHLFGARLQLQVHTDILSPWYRRGSWKERLRYLLACFLLPRADCLRVVSHRIKHSLVSELGIPESKIAVLPIFHDIGSFSHSSPNPEDRARLKRYSFTMIAAGRFVEKEKNFSMLINMMVAFARRVPDAVLVLVGDGPDKAHYTLQITNYKLEENIMIEPWRARNDLASFYTCFDIVVIPSNYEGWGLVAIEAMAAGLPVVMTDVGLAGEVVQDGVNGRIVPVGDMQAFLGACLNLYEHPEKRRAFADAARRTIAEMKPRNQTEYLEQYRKSFEECRE